MENLQFRIDGIYDLRTFNYLSDRYVRNYSFDFRPLSLNFLQQHKFLDLIDKSFNSNYSYYLHYCGEPEFVTNKMLLDLRNVLGKRVVEEHFILEFSDEVTPSFYQQFDLPFIWHYSNGGNLKEVLHSSLLKGIVLSYDMIEDMQMSGALNSFLTTFYQLLNGGDKDLELILSIRWDANILPSLFQLFDFNMISLPINNSIESCYRNVDFLKLGNSFALFTESIRIKTLTK